MTNCKKKIESKEKRAMWILQQGQEDEYQTILEKYSTENQAEIGTFQSI